MILARTASISMLAFFQRSLGCFDQVLQPETPLIIFANG
jgi:hypothetical protein